MRFEAGWHRDEISPRQEVYAFCRGFVFANGVGSWCYFLCVDKESNQRKQQPRCPTSFRYAKIIVRDVVRCKEEEGAIAGYGD